MPSILLIALPVRATLLRVLPNCVTPLDICVKPSSSFLRACSGFLQLPLNESTPLKKEETLPIPVAAPCLIPPNASNVSEPKLLLAQTSASKPSRSLLLLASLSQPSFM